VKVEYTLVPRSSDVESLRLIYVPRKNLVAVKYFELLEKFLAAGKVLDRELSYWNFFLEPQQKQELVSALRHNLAVLKLEPALQMDHPVSVEDSQDHLNTIHDKFEYNLKRINHGELVVRHHDEVVAALLQVNLLIHKIENYNSIQNQIIERGRDFVDCAFGYRFESDEFFSLEDHDYDHFTMERPFGSLSCGYNTTGKNLIHVMNDNDLELVRLRKVSPQRTYSTEGFFWFGPSIDPTHEYERFYKWFDANGVQKYGYEKYDRKNSIGMIPLADLEEPVAFQGRSHWEKLLILNRYVGIGGVRLL